MAGSSIDSLVTISVTLGVGDFASPLTITPAGFINLGAAKGFEAVALTATLDGDVVINEGGILGATGTLAANGTAGSGGVGILLGNGTLTNSGSIIGGFGSRGKAVASSTYSGGYGGDGVDAADGTVFNSGLIQGGTGGEAGAFLDGNGSGGYGVVLGAGSVLTNTGAIIGGYSTSPLSSVGGVGRAAVFATDANVTNLSTITGGDGGFVIGGSSGGDGVELRGGGTLTNFGVITGGYGPDPATTRNFEGYFSDGGTGAYLSNSDLINEGTIVGGSASDGFGRGARGVQANDDTIVNNGTIIGGSGVYGAGGVAIGGGTLFNNGLIEGAVRSAYAERGIYLYSSLLVNAGTIVGASGNGSSSDGYAVRFAGAQNRLILNPAGRIIGAVEAAGTTSVLELAAGNGTIAGVGYDTFAGFETVSVDTRAYWIVTSDSNSAYHPLFQPLNVTLAASSGITFDASIFPGSTVQFTAATGTLGIGDPSEFAAVVQNMQPGDILDFTTVSASGSIVASIGAGNTLTLSSDGSVLAGVQLDPAQDFSRKSFRATPDGSGGTIITEEDVPLCFLAGTMIATPEGEMPIERLAPGDKVLTANGVVQPIRWIGSGHVLATRNRRGPATPVIICKGAFADNVPNRDLRVTRAHAFLLDGALIPAEFLVNHRSIRWDDMAQQVAIHHIELENHDVVLANGAPAETYRDDGNRWLFPQAESVGQPRKLPPYAPVLTDGETVDAVWRHLLQRAGARPGLKLTDDPDLHLLADGQRIDVHRLDDPFYLFTLKTRPTELLIASRAAMPQELGLARDPRTLGVALRQIVLRQGARAHRLKADDPGLKDGFHAFETSAQIRWTAGNAKVPDNALINFNGPIEVVLQLAGGTRYLDPGTGLKVA